MDDYDSGFTGAPMVGVTQPLPNETWDAFMSRINNQLYDPSYQGERFTPTNTITAPDLKGRDDYYTQYSKGPNGEVTTDTHKKQIGSFFEQIAPMAAIIAAPFIPGLLEGLGGVGAGAADVIGSDWAAGLGSAMNPGLASTAAATLPEGLGSGFYNLSAGIPADVGMTSGSSLMGGQTAGQLFNSAIAPTSEALGSGLYGLSDPSLAGGLAGAIPADLGVTGTGLGTMSGLTGAPTVVGANAINAATSTPTNLFSSLNNLPPGASNILGKIAGSVVGSGILGNKSPGSSGSTPYVQGTALPYNNANEGALQQVGNARQPTYRDWEQFVSQGYQ